MFDVDNIIISPSILSSDFSRLGLEIEKLEQNGADWVHIDVMDGHFVPNLTFGSPVVKSLRKLTKMPFDVHLMIDNPLFFIPDFVNAGADIITFHYEASLDKTIEIINKIHSFGIKAGISIKPNTPVSQILKYTDIVDLVLIMTVEPGFGGQKFLTNCLDKIKEIKNHLKKETILEVDGGVNDVTAKLCINYGANALVAGNYIFSNNDISKAIKSLR